MMFGFSRKGILYTRILQALIVIFLSVIILLELFDYRLFKACNSIRHPVVICVEYEKSYSFNWTKEVQQLQPFSTRKYNNDGRKPLNDCFQHIQRADDIFLSKEEHSERGRCVANYPTDEKRDHTLFWSDNNQYVRWLHHTYLTSESIVIDVGGNVGEDAQMFVNKYSPHKYVILEPMLIFYQALLKRFEGQSNVIIYNFGVGSKDDKHYVNIEGTNGDATSVFKESDSEGTCPLHVVNATNFLLKLGVGCFEIDLLTINCEGCEFELLEAIVSTDIINFFRNIQFATHSKLNHLRDPVERYCVLQQKLARTHKLTYQYKFNWESWKRKDLR